MHIRPHKNKRIVTINLTLMNPNGCPCNYILCRERAHLDQ
jgi:hypothetical protein